jgi:putative lysine transport system permease protein
MKKRLLAVVLLSVFAFFLLSATSGILAETVTSAQEEDNTFKVGLEAGYPPFNWTQMDASNGAVKIQNAAEYAGGYDVEIAKIIAEGLGKELVIVKTEWDGLIPALNSGKIDAIIAGMSPTAERMKSIDFTANYYSSDLVMVVKRGGKYDGATSIQDFKGAKITAQLNTFHYTVIDQIEGVNKQTAMDNFPAMRVALESGIIDGYVSERPEAVSAQNANSNLKMIEFTDGFETSPEDTAVAVGIRKGSELKDKINETLAGISEEQRKELMDNAIKNQPSNEDTSIVKDGIAGIISEYWPMFLRGTGVTLLISIIGTIIGFIIGLLIGIIRTVPMPDKGFKKSVLKIINAILSVYIEVFRGTPMIVQAMVIYYGSKQALDIDMSPLFAGMFIVSINTGAYMAEIVRGGIVSIDNGQFEASYAIGMSHMQTMVNVVLPQAVRNILPAIGNEFVINIKDTSVLNVIAVTELFFQTKSVAGINFKYFETFFVASAIYLVLTFTVTRILRYIERKMDGPENYIMYANQMQVEAPEDVLRRKMMGKGNI